ncbi:hypothetical protein [Streptomyces sp. NPDC001415]
MSALAAGSDGLAHHLLMDLAIKGVIVVVAAIVLVLGMVVIWRRAGRGRE